MKPSRIIATALIASSFCSAPLWAKEPKPNGQKKELTREEIAKLGGFEPGPEAEDPEIRDIVADLLIVSVPDSVAIGLIEELKDQASSEAAARKLQSMVESKKARLIGWQNLQTKSGQRAAVENITEVRYAIEFARDPLVAPPAKDDAQGDAAAKAAEPPGPAAPAAIGVTPTSFETRNAGLSLEIEPITQPGGKVIDAQLCAQHVQLLGWDPTTVEQNGKTSVRMPQPRFHTNKVTTSLSAESGKRYLLGVFRSGDTKDETELFVFRAATKPKKAK